MASTRMRQVTTQEAQDLLLSIAFERGATVAWEKIDTLLDCLPALLLKARSVTLSLSSDQRDGDYLLVQLGWNNER